jgi:hypothetical protein
MEILNKYNTMTIESDNYIINLLQDKYTEYQSKWDYNDINDPNVLIYLNQRTSRVAALEWTDFGFFRITDSQSELTVLSRMPDIDAGQTFAMYKFWKEDDWNKFVQLYHKGADSNSFRTDIPLQRSTVDRNGHIWEFVSTKRPGDGIGQTDVHYFDKEKTRLENDVINLIDQYYSYIKAMKEISTDGLVASVNVAHALRDSEGFYFVKGFRGWNDPFESVIRGSIEGFRPLLLTFGFDDIFVKQWWDVARSKWESLL